VFRGFRHSPSTLLFGRRSEGLCVSTSPPSLSLCLPPVLTLSPHSHIALFLYSRGVGPIAFFLETITQQHAEFYLGPALRAVCLLAYTTLRRCALCHCTLGAGAWQMTLPLLLLVNESHVAWSLTLKDKILSDLGQCRSIPNVPSRPQRS